MTVEGVCVDCGGLCDDRASRCEECRVELIVETQAEQWQDR